MADIIAMYMAVLICERPPRIIRLLLYEWMDYYNNERTHQGKICCVRTPLETLIDGKLICAEKNLAQI